MNPPKPHGRRWIWALLIALAVFAGCACYGFSQDLGSDTAKAEGTSISAPESPESPMPTSEVDPGWIEGTYKVATEIPPGEYKTTGAGKKGDVLGGCYWARLKDTSGEVGSIIANDNVPSGAKARMTVRKTDRYIQFTGGCAWLKA